MFKLLLIPLNLALYFGLSTFISSEFSITQNAPERIEKLGECEVELTIDKGMVNGFAKLQHTFAPGIELEPIEMGNATFSYADQRMKIIWMALPADKSFTIKYKIKVTDPEITRIELGGSFSYLEDNKRMAYDIPTKVLNVGEDPNLNEEPKNPYADGKRIVESMGGDDYKVTIQIQKENIGGFAKIQDYVPLGANASIIKNQDAVFSVVENKVKFVWMNLPEGNQVEIAYKLTASNTNQKELQDAISGEFSFIHDGETQKLEIGSLQTNKEALALNTKTNEPKENIKSEEKDETQKQVQQTIEIEEKENSTAKPIDTNTKNTAQTQEKSTNGNPVKAVENQTKEETLVDNSPKKQKEEIITAKTQNIPATTKSTTSALTTAQSGVFYRVQILAGKNNVQKTYMQQNHNYSGDFVLENHEGWFKYTTGSFNEYKDARNGREDIRNAYNFPGPFVVAYNGSERITVQEALMISQQKWMK